MGMASGYRDLNCVIKFEGHLCEIQIHSLHYYKLKKDQTPAYEICRSLGLLGSLPTSRRSSILRLPKIIQIATIILHAAGLWLAIEYLSAYFVLLSFGYHLDNDKIPKWTWFLIALPPYLLIAFLNMRWFLQHHSRTTIFGVLIIML